MGPRNYMPSVFCYFSLYWEQMEMEMEMEMEKERYGLDRGDGLGGELAPALPSYGGKHRNYYGREKSCQKTAALEQRYHTFATEPQDDCKAARNARLKIHISSELVPGSSAREPWVHQSEGNSQFSEVDSSARVMMQVGAEAGLVNRSKAFAFRNWPEQEACPTAASQDLCISVQQNLGSYSASAKEKMEAYFGFHGRKNSAAYTSELVMNKPITGSLSSCPVDIGKEFSKPVAIRSWGTQCRSRSGKSLENVPRLSPITGPAEIKRQADADKLMPKPQKFDELHHTPNNIKRSYAGASQLSRKLPKPRHANYIEKSSGLEFERSMMKRASNNLERSSNKKKNVGFLEELSPSDSDNSMVQRALDSSEISISSFSENADVVSPSGDSKLLANKDTSRKRVAESSNASLKPVVKHSIFNRPVAFKSLNCSEVVKRKENAADPKKRSNQKLSPTSSASMLRRAEFHESPRVCKIKERSMQHSADLASQREAKARMKNKSRSLVLDTLKKFDLLRRKILRDENFSCRRPDLGAGKMMIRNRLRINELKRIGSVPGIEVGDQFFFRIEMLIVGLHMQVQAGIDFIVAKESRYNGPVAVSIIASVGYDYDRNNGETLIYTGQGGNVHRDQKQQEDQQLVRGNLALRNSNKNNLPVRVIRCYDRKNDKSDKIYTYDGLYQVVRIWHEISETSGCLVYKFCLQRLPDQPQSVKAFAQSLYSSFKD